MPGIKVFLSYSHADEDHLEELVKHLDLLRRQGLIEPWYDRRIEAGANVHAEIEDKLNAADVVLLLAQSGLCLLGLLLRQRDENGDGAASRRLGNRHTRNTPPMRLALGAIRGPPGRPEGRTGGNRTREPRPGVCRDRAGRPKSRGKGTNTFG